MGDELTACPAGVGALYSNWFFVWKLTSDAQRRWLQIKGNLQILSEWLLNVRFLQGRKSTLGNLQQFVTQICLSHYLFAKNCDNLKMIYIRLLNCRFLILCAKLTYFCWFVSNLKKILSMHNSRKNINNILKSGRGASLNFLRVFRNQQCI